jgi:hypothetical protein
MICQTLNAYVGWTLKELSSNTMDIIPSGSDCVYEDSSSSEYIASDGLQYR